MKTVNRNVFLDDLARESSVLQMVILNHSGTPERLHTDLSTIDLLSEKVNNETFLLFCQEHPLVDHLIVNRELMRARIQLIFKDRSELKIKLIRNMFKKGMKALPVNDIFKNANINEHGMLVPSISHQFEYILLKHQFAGVEFPDKYQKYFSSMNFTDRTTMFRYVQAKYNLIFNTIEDLYKPKASVRLKLIVGLRTREENSLFKMFLRTIAYFYFFTVRKIYKNGKVLYATSGKPTDHRKEPGKSSRRVVL